ncbi:hypothetical protein [Sodalis sp. RH16]|uniref:hypothetical protein n=1 Tax=Sodalis sp. RH16 TaxID=3394331 RepID=UPI0039B667F7
MFGLTWSCFHQNKETGEIEPLIYADQNKWPKLFGVSITCMGNRPDVSLCQSKHFKSGTPAEEISSGQHRQTGGSGFMAEHHLLFIRMREIIREWPPAVQRLAQTVFSERGLKHIENSELLGACKVLLARFEVFPPSCQLYLATEINRNGTRLTSDEKNLLSQFLVDLLKDGSYSCPACHYLRDILQNTRNSMLA